MDSDFQSTLAFSLRDKGEYEQALKELFSLLNNTSDDFQNAMLLANISTCYQLMGDATSAEEYLAKAQLACPHDPRVLATIAFLRSRALEDQQQYQKAEDAFGRILDDFPELKRNPELRFLYEDIQRRRAFDLMEIGRYEEALPLFQEALNFSLSMADRAALNCQIGICQYNLHEYDRAIENLSSAQNMELPPEWHASRHYYLGYCYYQKRQFETAKEQFMLCQELVESGEPGPPASFVYQLLEYTCRELGSESEAMSYRALRHPS